MKSLIALVEYNRWANLRVLHASSGLSQEVFTQCLPGSFRTIHATFVHLLWGESLWLERWQGRPFVPALNPEDFPSQESLRVSFESTHAQQLQFLAALPPSAEHSVIGYVNFQGQRWQYALRDMVQHLAIHSAHHRGQLTTAFRHVGVAPPTTGYLMFIDEAAKRTHNRAL